MRRSPQAYRCPALEAGVAPTRHDRDAIIPPRAAVRIHFVSTQRAATVELRSSLYADAVAIVEREYASDLSLDDIARRVASSRRQLQRAFAEIGGTTFRNHLTGVRMDRAAELLARPGLTVREVAHRVGYRQPAQFAKAFRRHLGVAPSDFRAARGAGRTGLGDGDRLAA
jgi:AraC family transcriptional regulator, regulatory protein of adaptative response / methylphosphotriester-DNA alkyltransferase methyltransferase